MSIPVRRILLVCPVLFALVASAQAQTFGGSNPITVSGTVGAVKSSTATVTGVAGTVTAISVTFNSLNVQNLNQVAIALVGPAAGGSPALDLLSGVCGDGTIQEGSATFTLADKNDTGASNFLGMLPENATGNATSCPTFSGTYLPTDYLPGGDNFPAPGPGMNYKSGGAGTTLCADNNNTCGNDNFSSTFGGVATANLNGTWTLYIVDQSNSPFTPSGSLGSWTITFTTSGGAQTTTTLGAGSPNPAFTNVNGTANPVSFSATVTPNPGAGNGVVTFFDGATAIASNVAINSSGVAMTSITFTTEGVHSITASYGGGSGFGPSPLSNAVTETTMNHASKTTNGDGSTSFCNGPIALESIAGGNPYPELLILGGAEPTVAGTIEKLTVTLNGLQTQDPQFLGFALQAPGASSAYEFLSWAGGVNSTTLNLTMSDTGTAQIPGTNPPGCTICLPTDNFDQVIPSGTVVDSFPAPAPSLSAGKIHQAAPTGTGFTFATEFGGLGVNGTWNLYLSNRAAQNPPLGQLASWCINVVMQTGAHPTQTVVSGPSTPILTNSSTTLTATVTTTDSSGPVIGGSVAFVDGATNLGSSNVNASGVASLSNVTLAEGTHSILASYSGTNTGTIFGISSGHFNIRFDNPITESGTAPYAYCNAGALAIPGMSADVGPAAPYPSNILVSDLPGTVKAVTVTLNGFTTTGENGLLSLLVGPGGNNLDFFSLTGASPGFDTFGPVNLTFDDNGAHGVINGFDANQTGSYKPSSFNTSMTYPACPPNALDCVSPAVGPPLSSNPFTPTNKATTAGSAILGNTVLAGVFGGTTASTYNGKGAWSLYLDQTAGGRPSTIGSGWCVNFTQNLPDISLTATPMAHAPGTFTRGQAASFTITATNNGPGPTGLPTLTITDTLPAGVTFTGFTGAGWNCSAAGQLVTCTNPNPMAANTSSAVAINVTVGAGAADTITNSATLTTGTGGDGNTSNNTTTSGSITVAGTILTINKTHTDPFTQGQTGATYNITVTNTGANGSGSGPGATVGTIQVTDALPNNFTVTSVSGGATWNCPVPTVVNCTLIGPLTVGSTTATIAVMVTVSNTMLGPVTNTAILTAATDQIGPVGDNSHDDLTHITQVPTQIAANAGTTPQLAALNTAFGVALGVTVLDAGNHPVQGVNVTFTPPGSGASGTFAVVSNGTQTCTAASCVVLTNAAGVATASAFTANGSGGAYTVSAMVATLSTTFNLTNTAPDLTISKAHVGANFTQGQNGAQYTLTVSNVGNVASSGTVTVTDTLPGGLTFASGTGTGWLCSAAGQVVTCTDAAAPIAASGSSPITLNVNVAANAGASLNNSAAVACTCTESNSGNNTSNTDTVNVTQLPDLTISKLHVGASFSQAQQGAQYTLTVGNQGVAASSGTITVTDTLPIGLTFASGSGTGWSCSANAQLVTCTDTATPIAASGTSAITLNVNVAGNASTPLNNSAAVACTCAESVTANNSSNTDVVTVGQLPDLTIGKVHVGANFTQNQQGAQYTITVTNGGGTSASGTITVSDTLSAGLTFAGGSGGGFLCSAGGPLVTCTSTTPIAAAGNAAITLNVNVAANAPASISNSASVACSCTEGNTGNNTSNTDVVNVTQLPDLTIAKAHVGAAFQQGQQGAQYTLTVSNAGGGPSSGTVTVTDTLPAALTFSSGSGTGWLCSAAGQVVTCTDAATPIAASGNSAITLNVNVAATAGATLNNSASVACSCTETNTGNNSSNTDTVNVTQLPDLVVTKAHVGANFTQGQQGAQYTITVTNQGVAATSGTITVTDTLVAGLTFASGSGTGWLCSANGQLTTCTNSATPIAVSGSSAITLNVNVSSTASAFLGNSASVACTCAESATNNNTSNTDSVAVNQLPDLTMTKAHVGASFSQGQQGAQYEFLVTNGGGGNTSGTVTVTDTLPAGLTFVSSSSSGGWSCSAVAQLVTCTKSTLIVPAETDGVFLSLNVAANAPASVNNTATVACSCSEGNTANNTSNTDTVNITQLPDLTITKGHVGTTFLQGQQGAQYALTVSNGGSGASSGTITVADTLTAGLTFVSGSGGGFSCSNAGQAVSCSSTTPIAANGSAVITLNVNVSANASTPLINSATVACTCGESNTTNNTSNMDSVNVSPGASSILITGGNNQAAGVNTAFAPLQILVKDLNGNPVVAGVSVTFLAPGAGASGTFANSTNSITLATQAGGTISVPFTANSVAGGPYSVTIAATGVASPPSFSLTNNPGGGATIQITGGNSQSMTVNTAFAPLQLLLKDSFGNPVAAGVSVTFTAPGTGASGLFANSTNTITLATVAGGTISAPFTANTIAGGTYNVTLASAGVNSPPSFSLTNIPGSASTIAITGGNNQSAAVTSSFAPLQIAVKDSFGNAVGAGVNVTFTAPASGASGTFANSTNTIVLATGAGGTISAPFTANAAVGGPYNVTLTSAGVVSPPSFSLTNTPGTAASILITGGNTQTATIGTAYAPLQIAVKDSFGNAVGAGVNVTFTAPASGASGTFANSTNTIVLATGAGGTISAAFTANSLAGSYGVVVTSVGVGSPPSFSLQNLAANVSGQVTVTQDGFGRNRATGIWSANMTVTNKSGSAITGPIQVVMTNLTNGVGMTNSTGTFLGSPFAGSPFITVSVGTLAAGASVTQSIQFENPSNGFINYTPVTYSGGLP